MRNNIKKRLDEYLEFDSIKLFENIDYLEIFGGAIRDSIAGLDIHDIDILCMRQSAEYASKILLKNGYKNVSDKLTTKDIQQIYKDVKIIFEPWTFMNNNLKIVQLIRPVSVSSFREFDMKKHISTFYSTMSEVDISCCGVSWNGLNVKENYKNAIFHCKYKIFEINEKAKMYEPHRTSKRQWKLEERGWKDIRNVNDYDKMFKTYIREKKLDRIIDYYDKI